MERIISDAYVKKNKHIFGDDPTEPYNQKILAINAMYGWLYEQGILEKVCFEFKDLPNVTQFAFCVKDLEPYRQEMSAADLPKADLAVTEIFDTYYSPCVYSGVIQLSWPMSTYRNVDGCVGRSWECDLIKGLNTKAIYDVLAVKEERGTVAAVKALYEKYIWEPPAKEKESSLDEKIYSAEQSHGDHSANQHTKTYDHERS